MSKILKGLNEANPHNYDSDWDYKDAVASSGRSRSSYRSQEDDTSDADIAYSKKMYQLGQKQKAAKEKAQRDNDHDRLASGTNEGMMPIGGNSTSTDRRKVMDLLQVYYKSMGGDFWEWFNQPGNKEFFAKRAEVSPDSAYEVVDSIDWGQHPQEEWPEDEEDMKEGLDNPWGDQGNFAGNKPVNVGGVSIKTIQTGDTVKYLGQPSKVVAMSKDRKYSRITISKGMGTVTQDVLTSDLQQLGQGVREEQLDELSNTKLGDYKTAAGADASKADSEGDYKRGNKRMSGIIKATKKEFANDKKKSSISQGINEFAPIKPPTAGAFGGNKDYGQPNSSRYIGGNKFVVGTTNNYVLTATIDKWGLEWDEDDEIWFLDSPGAAHIADASEGEIELPPPREQRNQIHDLVTDYLNERNSADLQKVAAYYGHSDDGEMATNEGTAEADEKPADPFKSTYPRVNNPKILGTQNRAKSIYHPPSKPNVKKLDKPLPENLGNELKSKSLEALQQVKQKLEQQRMAELEQWEKDFKQNTVSKFTAREPNLNQRATSTPMVAMPGEKHSDLKTRLSQLNKAIEKQGILDNLVQKLDKKGLMTPNIEAGVDTSMLARDGARDNYVELNKKLDKALEYVKNRLLTNKAAYAKPKSIDEDDSVPTRMRMNDYYEQADAIQEKLKQAIQMGDKARMQELNKQRDELDAHVKKHGMMPEDIAEDQLDELSCWPGHHRVAGTKAGAPGSCAKNKTNEQELDEIDRRGFLKGMGAAAMAGAAGGAKSQVGGGEGESQWAAKRAADTWTQYARDNKTVTKWIYDTILRRTAQFYQLGGNRDFQGGTNTALQDAVNAVDQSFQGLYRAIERDKEEGSIGKLILKGFISPEMAGDEHRKLAGSMNRANLAPTAEKFVQVYTDSLNRTLQSVQQPVQSQTSGQSEKAKYTGDNKEESQIPARVIATYVLSSDASNNIPNDVSQAAREELQNFIKVHNAKEWVNSNINYLKKMFLTDYKNNDPEKYKQMVNAYKIHAIKNIDALRKFNTSSADDLVFKESVNQGVAEGASSIEQKIIKLYKQGLSDDEIASRLKIDSDDVKSVLDDYEWVADTTGELKGVAEGLKQTLRKFDPTIKARIRQKSQDQTNQGIDTIQHLADLDLTSDDMVSRAMKPNTYFKNAERYAKLANKGVAEEQHSCPHCGGEMVSEELMNEKKDACYYKVKSRYKVWPSAYASGALVKCRNKGAKNWGNGGKKNESSILEGINRADESLHDWFNKEKWVRMDTKGKIKGPCAREPGEGKPKCLPQSKAHSLGKKGRASAAQRKRREDPNPERSGKAINVDTKKSKG